MRTNWRIGSLFDIPFYIDFSWFLILAFVTFINAGDVNASGLSGSSPLLGWFAGLILALLLFASVLLHELGHSLVARSQGISVNSITLFLFGGIASIDRESKTPGEAFLVAIAGPVVSLILFALFLSLTRLGSESSLLGFVAADLARINLVLALFNLIPGLPLDGGQVLKAVVWKCTGDRFSGMRWASASGKLMGFLGISVGLLLVLLTGEISAVWIAFIGWFVLRNASAYDRLTGLQESLLNLVAADAMDREFRVVNANLTLRDFAQEYILAEITSPSTYYAASEGRYRGLIRMRDLHSIERSEWESKTLANIAHPLTEIPSVQEKTSLLEVINCLEQIEDRRITVLSPSGAVAGVIDRGDLVKAIAVRQNLSIPDAEIKRIKAEGTYPAYMQLAAIAKSVISNQ
ncbi:site-2 protease family protein [Hydrococcus rivularis NIES-593]|uniref:Zinc metalloprotease n=1 Tax=Hydrococcus rivularis NIES-593 TaxID=1921803 RepID=A0A1U7HH90_9CYAN|nr:site-2 protease family protein [Hydrococcus rivularis]OKH22956.1 site-2 protease family protein [Hydrococcus rivularis NIES-593]